MGDLSRLENRRRRSLIPIRSPKCQVAVRRRVFLTSLACVVTTQ